MNRHCCVVIVLALLAFAACTDKPKANEFELSGRVVKVQAGLLPPGVPEPTGTPRPVQDRDPGTPRRAGVLVIQSLGVPESIKGCKSTKNLYLVYYQLDSQFEPKELTANDRFPLTIRGALVDVKGTFARCLLTARTTNVHLSAK